MVTRKKAKCQYVTTKTVTRLTLVFVHYATKVAEEHWLRKRPQNSPPYFSVHTL